MESRRHSKSPVHAEISSRNWRSTGLKRQTKTQLRVCTNCNHNKRCGFGKSRQFNWPRQNARSRDCLTQGTFGTIMTGNWRAFWRIRPRFCCRFLVVVMTLLMRMLMHRTGSNTHAAGIFHQRMQPRCTRRKNQLPASQHQSKELCRTPTHSLSVQFHERNRMYVVLTHYMLIGLTSGSKLNAG